MNEKFQDEVAAWQRCLEELVTGGVGGPLDGKLIAYVRKRLLHEQELESAAGERKGR